MKPDELNNAIACLRNGTFSIPAKQWIRTLLYAYEDAAKRTLIAEQEIETLRACNEQLVISEQSIRNHANQLHATCRQLRSQVQELEGRIDNALL